MRKLRAYNKVCEERAWKNAEVLPGLRKRHSSQTDGRSRYFNEKTAKERDMLTKNTPNIPL